MAGSITVELGTGVTSFSYAWENTNGNRTPTGTGTKTTTSSIYCNNCDHIYITNVKFKSGYGPSFSFGGSTSTTSITFYPTGSGTYTVKGVQNSTPTTYTYYWGFHLYYDGVYDHASTLYYKTVSSTEGVDVSLNDAIAALNPNTTTYEFDSASAKRGCTYSSLSKKFRMTSTDSTNCSLGRVDYVSKATTYTYYYAFQLYYDGKWAATTQPLYKSSTSNQGVDISLDEAKNLLNPNTTTYEFSSAEAISGCTYSSLSKKFRMTSTNYNNCSLGRLNYISKASSNVEVYASMIDADAGYAYVNGETHKTIKKGSFATWTCDLNAGYTFNRWAPSSGSPPANANNPSCTVDNILLDLTLLCYTNYVGTVTCKAVAGTGIKHAYVNEAASATVTKGNTVSYTCTVDTDNGYYFDGWYTSNGQIYSSNQSFDVKANTNLTLYAKGIKNSVEVYANMITPNAGYAYVNGEVHKTITKGSFATWTCDLNAGYTFDHWAPTSGPLPTNAYNPSCTVDNIQSDLTLLCYTNYVGTVICKAVASTGIKYAYVNDTSSVTVTKNTKVYYTCTVDTNNGYHFDGWYTRNDAGDEELYTQNQSFDVIVQTNLTLYAKGSKEESVTVTALLFDDGSLWAQVNNAATTKITKGSSATWTCALKTGYIFDYWAPSSGDQPANAHNQTCLVQNILLDLTLWCHTKYVGTVTCKAIAGEGISSAKVNNEDSVILNKGSTATWTCSVKTSEGYNFIGWFNGNIRVSQSLSYTPPGGINTDLTLEARAAKNITYTLSFDANGGSGAPNSLTYTGTDSSHTFTIPNATPSYVLHKFLGWHTDKASTIAIYGGDTENNIIVLKATNPTIKLYAVWKEYKYFTWMGSDADDDVLIQKGKPFCITSQKWNDFNTLIKYLKPSYRPTSVLQGWQFSYIYMRETVTVLQGLTTDPFPGFTDNSDPIEKNKPIKASYFTELKTYLNNKLKNL